MHGDGAPRGADPAATPAPADRETVRDRAGCSCSSARSRAPTGWTGCSTATSAGFVLTGPDLVLDGSRPARLDARPRPVPPGGQLPGVFAAGDVRADVGQAGRLGRRRGRDGRHAGAPLPGGTDERPHRTRCTPGRAAHAVPVRGADRRAARTGWPSTARVEQSAPVARSFTRGRRRRPASSCCCRRARAAAPGRTATRSRSTAPTSAASYARRHRRPTWATGSSSSTPRTMRAVDRPPASSCCRRTTSPRRCATWFPMAMHLLEGLFLGMRNTQRDRRRSASGCSPSARCPPG